MSGDDDPYAQLKSQHPTFPAEPVIRYSTLIDGTEELDEVIAVGTMHLEKMNAGQWWIGLNVGDRMWHINLGAGNPRVKDYASIEEQ